MNGLTTADLDVVENEKDMLDKCLVHAYPGTKALHAHTISPCACSSCGSTEEKPGACNDVDDTDLGTTATECFPDDYSYQSSNWEDRKSTRLNSSHRT